MVYSSPLPPVQPTEVPVHELVLANATARGAHPALVDPVGGRTLSYAVLAASVDRLAADLAASGLRKGDVLALHSPNTVLFPVVLLAASRIGVVVTPVPPRSTAREIAAQLVDSGARRLVTVAALRSVAEAAAHRAGIADVIVGDATEDSGGVPALAAVSGPVPDVTFDVERDLFVLPYSRGTTGRSKGVMLTHRNVGTNSNQVVAASGAGSEDRVLAVLPFCHMFGMAVLLNYLRVGGTLVVLPQFGVHAFFHALAEYRISRLYAVPPMVHILASHPAVETYDLSCLREVLSAAAPLELALAEDCARRLGIAVVQGYGMTELSPASHLVPDEVADPAPGSIGTLLPSTEARVVDPACGRDVAVGEVGELWIRGPQVMRGYFGRPAATAATVDGQGWLHTGDLARTDAQGHWFVVDRVTPAGA